MQCHFCTDFLLKVVLNVSFDPRGSVYKANFDHNIIQSVCTYINVLPEDLLLSDLTMSPLNVSHRPLTFDLGQIFVHLQSVDGKKLSEYKSVTARKSRGLLIKCCSIVHLKR